jgi:molecular chaperone DnaK
MKEEAAANADADKREKERIEKLNQADSLIFQTEKQLTELGDKIPSDKKAQIESALTKLKEAHKSQDLTGIESATAELTTVFHAATQDLYGKAVLPLVERIHSERTVPLRIRSSPRLQVAPPARTA